MSHADAEYKNLVTKIISQGSRKENRTGIDTLSLFGYNYSLDLQAGFPILTTKKIEWKNIVIENLWFLSGSSNLEFMHHYDVKFWDPWADENNNVWAGYGPEWRSFNKTGFDQIKHVLNGLLTTPDSRRLVVTAWNPLKAYDNPLPPCHMTWVLNVQNKYKERQLNLALMQRSCDVALGLPYNMAGYGFLLHLFAHLANMQVGVFNHTLVDAHIYTAGSDGTKKEYDHIPGLRKQCNRVPHDAPIMRISNRIRDFDDVREIIETRPPIDELLSLFQLHHYFYEPPIAFKVAV